MLISYVKLDHMLYLINYGIKNFQTYLWQMQSKFQAFFFSWK